MYQKIKLLLGVILVLSSCFNINRPKIVNDEINEAFYQEVYVDSSGIKMFLLMGEDGGGWFSISDEDILKDNEYRIKIYFEDKSIISDLVFKTDQELDLNEEYKFIPLSNGEICTILQKKEKIILRYVRDYH
jgi:hypothetical protein